MATYCGRLSLRQHTAAFVRIAGLWLIAAAGIAASVGCHHNPPPFSVDNEINNSKHFRFQIIDHSPTDAVESDQIELILYDKTKCTVTRIRGHTLHIHSKDGEPTAFLGYEFDDMESGIAVMIDIGYQIIYSEVGSDVFIAEPSVCDGEPLPDQTPQTPPRLMFRPRGKIQR